MAAALHKKLFIYGGYVSCVLFVFALAGTAMQRYAAYYLEVLSMILKYYVSAFLLIQFNPFVRIAKHDAEFDRKVAFSAGVFLLLTTTATAIAQGYVTSMVRRTTV